MKIFLSIEFWTEYFNTEWNETYLKNKHVNAISSPGGRHIELICQNRL